MFLLTTRGCFLVVSWRMAQSAVRAARGAMPYFKKRVIRYWCPLGDECGKKNSHLNYAENREAEEQQLAQHLRGQPAHVEAGMDEESIADAVSIANYEDFEKEVYTRSPPRSTKGDRADVKGEKAAGRDTRAIGTGNASDASRRDARRDRDRSIAVFRTVMLKDIKASTSGATRSLLRLMFLDASPNNALVGAAALKRFISDKGAIQSQWFVAQVKDEPTQMMQAFISDWMERLPRDVRKELSYRGYIEHDGDSFDPVSGVAVD
jgi:hypothetical protein